MPDLPQRLSRCREENRQTRCEFPTVAMCEPECAIATTSSRFSNTRRTVSGPLKRHLVTAGSATFAMLSRLPAEYGRAVEAAQRYDELRCSRPPQVSPSRRKHPTHNLRGVLQRPRRR